MPRVHQATLRPLYHETTPFLFTHKLRRLHSAQSRAGGRGAGLALAPAASLLPQYGNYWIISRKPKWLCAIRLPNTSLLIFLTFHKYFILFPRRFPVNCNILPARKRAGGTRWTAPRPQLGPTLPASWSGTDVRTNLFPVSHTYLIAVKASTTTGLLPARMHSV